MMKTFVGPVFDDEHVAYLRAETCQPIFVDYDSVRVATRQKIPFGIAQIGKAFRNEINPRNFTFRSREFTQMEMEFFCREEDSMQWFEYWKAQRIKFYTERLGFGEDFYRIYVHENLPTTPRPPSTSKSSSRSAGANSKAFTIAVSGTLPGTASSPVPTSSISTTTTARNSRPPWLRPVWGWTACSSPSSPSRMTRIPPIPARRASDQDVRVVLRLPAVVPPVRWRCCRCPRTQSARRALYNKLNRYFRSEYDVTGSIGKRYRRQDEIGTPFCLTFDFESENDNSVTVRERDSMKQERVAIPELRDYLEEKIGF